MSDSLTYNEWLAKGYHVIKGQKATGRNKAGVATFKKSQVTVNHSYHGDSYDEYDGMLPSFGDTQDMGFWGGW